MSLVVFIGSWLGAMAIVARLLVNYRDPKTSHPTILICVFCCWLFPFSLTFLLPMDIASTRYEACLEAAAATTVYTTEPLCQKSILYVSAGIRHATWLAVYWATFLLSWLLLPFLQGYVIAGQFDVAGKARYSLKVNLYFYLGALLVGSLLVMCLRYGTSTLNTWKAVLALLMALSNSIGLLYVVLFLGYGLVRIPRHFWHSANVLRLLRKCEAQALAMKEKYQDAQDNLTSILREIQGLPLRLRSHPELMEYVDILIDSAPLPSEDFTVPEYEHKYEQEQEHEHYSMDDYETSLGPFGPGFRKITQPNRPSPVSMEHLELLNYRLKDALGSRARAEWEWYSLCRRAWHYQDILHNQSHSIDRLWTSTVEPPTKTYSQARMMWWWNVHLRGILYRLLAIVCVFLSFIILWSEVTLPLGADLSLVSYFVRGREAGLMNIELATLVLLLYVAYCCYSSFLRMNVFSYFQLVPGHHTDEKSLLFFSAYFTRFTLPLGYNYLTLVEGVVQVSEDVLQTQFSRVMGTMDLVPLLGKYFNIYVPLSLAVISLLVLFRLHKTVLNLLCGWATASPPTVHSPATVASSQMDRDADLIDGRDLISQARRAEERLIRSVVQGWSSHPYRRPNGHNAFAPDPLPRPSLRKSATRIV